MWDIKGHGKISTCIHSSRESDIFHHICKVKEDTGTDLLGLCKKSLTRQRVHQVRLLSCAFGSFPLNSDWVSSCSSPLQRAGPTRGGKKGLQVGCLPRAISWTHTPAWLINGWIWVYRSHSAKLKVLPWWPGCISVCTLLLVTHLQGCM